MARLRKTKRVRRKIRGGTRQRASSVGTARLPTVRLPSIDPEFSIFNGIRRARNAAVGGICTAASAAAGLCCTLAQQAAGLCSVRKPRSETVPRRNPTIDNRKILFNFCAALYLRYMKLKSSHCETFSPQCALFLEEVILKTRTIFPRERVSFKYNSYNQKARLGPHGLDDFLQVEGREQIEGYMRKNLDTCYNLLIKTIDNAEINAIYNNMLRNPRAWYTNIRMWTSPSTRLMNAHGLSIDSLSDNAVIVLKIIYLYAWFIYEYDESLLTSFNDMADLNAHRYDAGLDLAGFVNLAYYENPDFN
jgi:hypothetical protein